MFMCVAISNSPPTSILTLQIFRRQNEVVDLLSPTTYNTYLRIIILLFVSY